MKRFFKVALTIFLGLLILALLNPEGPSKPGAPGLRNVGHGAH